MSVIDDYLKDVTPTQKTELERVRTIVKQVVPDAEETIGYGIPTLKYKGKNLIHFAAFKDHMSLFPTSKPIESMKKELEKFKVSKGTLQFTEENPIPESIIVRLVEIRLAEIQKK